MTAWEKSELNIDKIALTEGVKRETCEQSELKIDKIALL